MLETISFCILAVIVIILATKNENLKLEINRLKRNLEDIEKIVSTGNYNNEEIQLIQIKKILEKDKY